MQKQESNISNKSNQNIHQNQKSWTLIRTIPIDGDLQKSFPFMTNQQISINLVELNLASLYNQKLQNLILQRMKDTQFYLMNRHILENVINIKTQKDFKKIKQITTKFDQEYVNGDIQKYAQSYVQTTSNSYTQKPQQITKQQNQQEGSQQLKYIQNKISKIKIDEIQLSQNQMKFHSQLKLNNEKKMLNYTKKKQYRAKFIQRRQEFVSSLQQISQKLFKNKNNHNQTDIQSKTNELFQNLIMQLNQKISGTDQIKSTSSVDSDQNFCEEKLQFSETYTKNSEFQSVSSSFKDSINNKISFFKTTGYKFYFKKQYHQVTEVILERSKPIHTKNRNPLLLDFGFNRFIYKDDDQLSHEIIAMKLIQYFNILINGDKKNKQNIIVQYEIIPQAKGALYEFVQNATTIAHIKKNFQNLSEYFKYLADQQKLDLNIIKKRFSQTYAGFCIAQFLLNIKDRNNANIMIKNDAFIFQSKPGGINFEAVPFKMTKQYVKLLGGFDSDHFAHFQSILIQIFTKLNQCKDEFLAKLLILSSRSKQIRCFKGFNFQKYCQQKICSNLNKVREFIQKLIDDSYDNWRTKKYDAYQFKTNKIPQ